MKAFRVLVTGDRNWSDAALIQIELIKLIRPRKPSDVILINGGARGADLLAKKIGEQLGFWVVMYEPSRNMWPAAGPIRNTWMLKEGLPNFVLAFHDDLRKSKGTKDMVKKVIRAGIPYRLIGHA